MVWVDSRDGEWDIYGYDLSTSTEFPICTQVSSQSSPAIYCNVVVWKDYRNGNYDIYGATLDTNFCTGVPSAPPLRNPDTNKPIMPLAAYRISQVQSLLDEVQKTCDKLKDENDPLYSACCVDRLDEVTEYLEMAEKFYMGRNYIAANYWTLKALELLQEIEECCTQ